MNQETLKKYAHTLLKYGVNLQQDQTLSYFCRCRKQRLCSYRHRRSI